MDNYKEEDVKEKNEIYGKIAKVVHLVCNNPSVFVSETDIHALMMNALMEIPHLDPFTKDGLCSINVPRGTGASSKYITMLIHKEYGHNIKSYARSDIVILDKSEIKKIDDPINLKKEKGKKYLIPKYIFEFGTDKSGGIRGYEKHLYGDFIKLFECKDEGNGFLIHIHRFDTTNDPDGTKANEKIEGYHKKTSAIWDKVKGCKKPEMDEDGKVTWNPGANEYPEEYPDWESAEEVPKFKFKVLIFFVKIGGPSVGRGGRVQMFNPNPKKDSKVLIGVEQGGIKKIIKAFLKEDNPDLAEIKS
ncbi:MAG: hypothetical protein HOF76_05530 [Candidatus Scalindua sp.]|nr:hypothetical protein [Candidatus Scalindua sp.]